MIPLMIVNNRKHGILRYVLILMPGGRNTEIAINILKTVNFCRKFTGRIGINVQSVLTFFTKLRPIINRPALKFVYETDCSN